MRLPILTLPDSDLRKRSTEVDPEEIHKPEFQAWLDDLVETMHIADGIGIAAPQVGRLIRVFVAVDKHTPHIIINPEVAGSSWRRANDEEGCLSVPGKYGVVSRHKTFKLRALNRGGKMVRYNSRGFFARVLQHELDHLNGILFIDKAKKIVNITL